MTSRAELFLYSRESCPPCREFKRRLDSLVNDYSFDCHVIDIDSDPVLERRYGHRVPVLVLEGAEICEGQLDELALRNRLEVYRAPG